jgi:hypothetical protein
MWPWMAESSILPKRLASIDFLKCDGALTNTEWIRYGFRIANESRILGAGWPPRLVCCRGFEDQVLVYHFIQILPINERTLMVTETPRKHPGQIHIPSNRTSMVSVVTCRHLHVGRREDVCYSRIYSGTCVPLVAGQRPLPSSSRIRPVRGWRFTRSIVINAAPPNRKS